MNVTALIDQLDGALPGFATYVVSGGCEFSAESAHGVFAAFSGFARDRDSSMIAWSMVADLVNDVVGKGGDLDEAACTCLLENLARHDHPLRPLLVGEAAGYWDLWL